MHSTHDPVVAIPARNEEALLPRLVAALSRQTVLARMSRPLNVVIVLSNTDDGSGIAAQAAAVKAPGLQLTLVQVDFLPGRAHVGSARRRAMEIAANLAPGGVILTTDADAVPADDWIEANLRAIAAGADIVGGHIIGDPEEEARLGAGFLRRAWLHARYGALRDELAWLLDPVKHDPWPRHHDHTGGSLAVRSAVYRSVGGLDPLPFREDFAFVSKVRAAGFRLRHPLDVTVTVSARTEGRAIGGMADCLSAWIREEAEGVPVFFEAPAGVEDRLRRRRAIRDLDRSTPLGARGLPGLGIARADRQYGELSVAALIERFAQDDPDAVGTVPALAAIAALEARINMLRGQSDAA